MQTELKPKPLVFASERAQATLAEVTLRNDCGELSDSLAYALATLCHKQFLVDYDELYERYLSFPEGSWQRKLIEDAGGVILFLPEQVRVLLEGASSNAVI